MKKGTIHVVCVASGDGYHLHSVELVAWFMDSQEAEKWAAKYDKDHNVSTTIETVGVGVWDENSNR